MPFKYLLALVTTLVPAAVFAAAASQPAPLEVLNNGSPWRYHASWRTFATGQNGKYDLGGGYPIPTPGTRWILNSFSEPTPPPTPLWMAADFDDSGWPRHAGPLFAGYGYGQAAEIYLLCGRARFGVDDPARAGVLKLTLAYRGGVVVHLNGAEIARGHMPSGKVEPLTLAEDYAKEVFVGADGAVLPPPPERAAIPAGSIESYKKRVRALNIELPARLLTKGTNTLALELHRAAIPPALPTGAGKSMWGSCGIESISLTGAADAGLIANVGDGPSAPIWNCSPLVRAGIDVKNGDPLEPLRPVRLAVPRNGVASAQVVVSSEKPLHDIAAVVSDLKTESGAGIKATCVEVRYAATDERTVKLLAKPSLASQLVPIWLTARIPKDAAPGQYRGTLTVKRLDVNASVPIELAVYSWMLPDVRDFGTSVTLLHSPEAIARHYNVVLWSDQHFKLMEKSMALMGYVGNTLLSVSALGEDLLGDDPVIVFRKEGDKYVPDFRFARRFMELYDKQAGPPWMLSVQVWNYSISNRGPGTGRDGGKQRFLARTLKVRFLEGDKLVPAEMPVYTQPGTEEAWTAVVAGIKQIVKDLGWNKTRLLWGTGGDNLPNEEIVAFFKKIAPDMTWRVATHGGSVRNWGKTTEERTQNNGLVLGYVNLVRRNYTRRPLLEDCPFDVLKRDSPPGSPADFLGMGPLCRIAAGYSGFGFSGFDGWGWTDPSGRSRGPIRHHVPFGNIGPSGGPFVAPGPDGAVSTPQLEALREGLQITEAILQLRAALADPQRSASIKPEIAAEAKAVIQCLLDVLESNRRVRPAGVADIGPLARRIYELVSEVATGTHYDVRTQK